MAAIHWTNDDTGYEQWLSNHPGGFVANTHNPPTAKYFRLHRASHNLPDRSNPDSVNPRTGRQYSKVTAESIGELNAWAKENVPGFKGVGKENYCKTCGPTDDSPIESEPTADPTEYVLRADRIRARGPVPRPVGVITPAAVQCSTTIFYRDPKVRAWTFQRAEGRCELCAAIAPFLTIDEEPYLESHHIAMLAEGGPDTPNNTAALCPNCHRNLHYGINRAELRDRLAQLLADKEAALAFGGRG